MGFPRTPILDLGDYLYDVHARADSSENRAVRIVAQALPRNEWRHGNKLATSLATPPLTMLLGVIAATVSAWSVRLPFALMFLWLAEEFREVMARRRRT